MPTHQYTDGNESPTSAVTPTLEVEAMDSSDDLQDHRLHTQTIQWDANAGLLSPNLRRASSSGGNRRPRIGTMSQGSRSDSINPDRRSSYSSESDSERDLALASPTLPPSAMPSALVADNRSFKDLELPLPGITERPREDSDPQYPSSSGSSSRSQSPHEPRGEDFHRAHQTRYHRHRRSTGTRRPHDNRAFTPRRPTSDRDRRPTISDPRIPTRTRAPTVSSVVVTDDVDSHIDSNEDNSEIAEEDVCFPMAEDDLRDQRGIDFAEMEDFAREMRELLGSLDLTDEQRRGPAPETRDRNVNPIRRGRSGSRVSTMDEKREVCTALHHHPAYKFDRIGSHESIDAEKCAAQRNTLPKLSTTASISRPADIGKTLRGESRGDRKHDRFTFFTPGMEETNQAEEFCDLVEPDESYATLFDQRKGTWWLDVLNPSVEEMKMLSKAFNIHPLTNEDIRTQETREKVELFPTYYFVCFRSFENDPNSAEYLEAANMYIVVFRGGLLTFHFTTTPHAANVRRRIRQLRDYVSVSSDWICYALIDDITDAFGPLVIAVEGETEGIEDAVLVARADDTGDMLKRISLLRKKIMGLLKLLGGKADVIKMFAKRCNENWDVAPTGEIGLYLGDIQGTITPNHPLLNSY